MWANNNATPLERPSEWAGKTQLTDEELAALRTSAAQATDPGQDALFGDQLVLAAIAGAKAETYDPETGNYNQFWIVERDFSNRTSLVVDPPDGRIPALTGAAERRQVERAVYRLAHPADSWVDVPLQERCITYGVPRLGAGYNSYYQIFQSAEYVVFLMAMNHDARMIPLDGRTALDPTSVARGLARSLEGRYPGCRDEEPVSEEPLPWIVGQATPRRAVHARRPGFARLRGHGHRPDHLDRTVDGIHSPDAER